MMHVHMWPIGMTPGAMSTLASVGLWDCTCAGVHCRSVSARSVRGGACEFDCVLVTLQVCCSGVVLGHRFRSYRTNNIISVYFP